MISRGRSAGLHVASNPSEGLGVGQRASFRPDFEIKIDSCPLSRTLKSMRTRLRRVLSGVQRPAFVLVLACVLLLGETAEAGLQKGALKFAAANREEKLLADPVAALRAAQTAQAAGKLTRARTILREVSVRHPAVSDYVDTLRAQLALDQSDPKRALLIAQQALAAAPSPLVQSALYGVLAQAEATLGNGVAARAAWAEALSAPHSIQDRPVFELAIAESLQADGEVERAQEKYLKVWAQFPRSEQAAVAGRRLDALADSLETDPRKPGIAYRRAENLYNANRNELALQEFEAILAIEEISGRLRKRAGRQRANVLFRMRRYPEAIVAYQGLPSNSQIKISIARARARSGDVNGAVTELLQLDKSTPKGTPQRAGYLAALLLDDESGRELEAAKLFTKLATPRNAGAIRNESTWRLGWRAYRDGKYPEAVRHFDQLAGYEGDSIAGLRPRYWRARALEKQGDLAAAKEAFLLLASEYPLTYYGWRSRLRESQADDAGQSCPSRTRSRASPSTRQSFCESGSSRKRASPSKPGAKSRACPRMRQESKTVYALQNCIERPGTSTRPRRGSSRPTCGSYLGVLRKAKKRSGLMPGRELSMQKSLGPRGVPRRCLRIWSSR